MNKENLKVGDMVIISGNLTGYGVLDGFITDIKPFFGRILITAQYTSDSILKSEGRPGIVGYSEFFALKDK